MKKAMRKTALMGLSTLAIAGCEFPKTFHGTFRDYEVDIIKGKTFTEMQLLKPPYGTPIHYISAIDNDGDLIFDYIIYEGSNVITMPSKLKARINTDPLFNYANQDSLNAAYNAVMEQNKTKTQGAKK